MTGFLGTLLTVMLGNGLVMAIVRFFFDRQKEKRERADAITYLTLQLAFQFEGFAIDCERMASANQEAEEHEGAVGEFISAVPQPSALPTSDA